MAAHFRKRILLSTIRKLPSTEETKTEDVRPFEKELEKRIPKVALHKIPGLLPDYPALEYDFAAASVERVGTGRSFSQSSKGPKVGKAHSSHDELDNSPKTCSKDMRVLQPQFLRVP